MVKAACRLRILDLRRKAEEQKRQEFRRIQEEKEAEARQEHERVKKLLHDVNLWQRSQAMHAYIAEVRSARSAGNPDPEVMKQLEKWVAWTTMQADLLDPTVANSQRRDDKPRNDHSIPPDK
jgi:hypothetical protein